MNQTLSEFSDPSQMFSNTSTPITPTTGVYKNYPTNSHVSVYPQYPLPQAPSDVANQFALFDGLASSLDIPPIMGVSWESASSLVKSKAVNGGYTRPPSNNDFSVRILHFHIDKY
jgi:hypothetical protein